MNELNELNEEQWEEEIRRGFEENGLCDTYGYCDMSCKYWVKCHG